MNNHFRIILIILYKSLRLEVDLKKMKMLDLLDHELLLPRQPDLLLVLLEDVQLVPQLLGCL